MAIAPISSISTRNNYIGFSGNKKSKNTYNESRNSSTSIFKAVPLAAAIIMSPLNVSSSQAQNYNPAKVKTEQVNLTASDKAKGCVSREVVSPNGSKPVQVLFLNDDGSKNVKSVDIQTYSGYLKDVSLEKIKFNIIGDDGIPADKVITFPAVISEERGRAIVNKDLYNYLLNFENNGYRGLKSDAAVAIKDKVFVRGIRPSDNGELQNVPRKQDWIEKGKSEKESFGIEFFNEPVAINTSKGNYNVRAYSSISGNLGKSFQAVTIEKDGAEFLVKGLYNSHIRMNDTEFNDFDSFDLKVIELKKRNCNERAFIINDELYDALLTAKNDVCFDNAFKTEAYSPLINTNGRQVWPTYK